MSKLLPASASAGPGLSADRSVPDGSARVLAGAPEALRALSAAEKRWSLAAADCERAVQAMLQAELDLRADMVIRPRRLRHRHLRAVVIILDLAAYITVFAIFAMLTVTGIRYSLSAQPGTIITVIAIIAVIALMAAVTAVPERAGHCRLTGSARLAWLTTRAQAHRPQFACKAKEADEGGRAASCLADGTVPGRADPRSETSRRARIRRRKAAEAFSGYTKERNLSCPPLPV
jgi:hypothetical protein